MSEPYPKTGHKSWLDNMIVPAIVEEWLAEHLDKRRSDSGATTATPSGAEKTDRNGGMA